MQRAASVAWAFALALTFKKSWKVNGSLVNASSAAIGILDDTTGLQTVAAGTAMLNSAPGEYCYTLRTALPEHAYTATIVVSYLGQSYTSTQTVPATRTCATPAANPSLAQSQDLGQAIAENAMSAESVQSAAGSQKSHPLTEQIAADRYLASKRAAQRGRPGIRIMQREGNASG
jgi:hypothetical protein